MELLYLRGHHLFCIQFFQGYGYNSKFTKKMGQLISNLKNNPSLIIKLTTSCDSICANCPWYKENNCRESSKESENKLIEKDKQILSLLDLEEGTIISAGKLNKKVIELLSNINLVGICGKCQWFAICQKQHKQKKLL